MDYGKFKYEEAQKAKEARRNQANTILKEVRFRLKIDKHDYETKRKRAEGFLQAGDKVKAMILFRGREQSRPEQGVRLLQRFAEDVSEFGSVESTPMIDGRNMVMVIGPHKTKATAKAEAEARKVANKPARTSEQVSDAADAPESEAPVEVAAPAAAAPVVEAPVAAPVVEEPAAQPEPEEPAKVEAPKAEAPKAAAPKAAAPKAEASKEAAPKAATPKATPAKPAATPKATPAKPTATPQAPVPAKPGAAKKAPTTKEQDA